MELKEIYAIIVVSVLFYGFMWLIHLAFYVTNIYEKYGLTIKLPKSKKYKNARKIKKQQKQE